MPQKRPVISCFCCSVLIFTAKGAQGQAGGRQGVRQTRRPSILRALSCGPEELIGLPAPPLPQTPVRQPLRLFSPQKASHVKHPSVLSGVFTGRFSFDRPWAPDDTGASEEDMTSWNCFGEFFLPPFQKLIAEAETDNAAVGNFPRSLCHDVGLFKWKKKDAAWLFCISATSLALVWRQMHFLLLIIDNKKKKM